MNFERKSQKIEFCMKSLSKSSYIIFWGFSMVKIHFYKKSSKNGLVSEKNTYLFPLLGGGGPDPTVEFSPSLIIIHHNPDFLLKSILTRL